LRNFVLVKGWRGNNLPTVNSSAPCLQVSGVDTDYTEFLVFFISNSRQVQW